MSWGAIGASAVSLVGSKLLGGSGSNGGAQGQAAANAADPFASQRSQYQPMLADLIKNPSSVTSTPGYQFNLEQGLGSVQAGNAARGIGTSGANDAAKMQFASGLASQTYQQDFNNLALLSGATSGNTGAAASAIQTGNANTNSALGTVAGALGNQFKSWMGSSSGSSGGGGTTSGSADLGSLLQSPMG